MELFKILCTHLFFDVKLNPSKINKKKKKNPILKSNGGCKFIKFLQEMKCCNTCALQSKCFENGKYNQKAYIIWNWSHSLHQTTIIDTCSSFLNWTGTGYTTSTATRKTPLNSHQELWSFFLSFIMQWVVLYLSLSIEPMNEWCAGKRH